MYTTLVDLSFRTRAEYGNPFSGATCTWYLLAHGPNNNFLKLFAAVQSGVTDLYPS